MAEIQRRAHRAMGGFGRMHVASKLFVEGWNLLSLRYGTTLEKLAHLHRRSLTAQQWNELAEVCSRDLSTYDAEHVS